MRGDFCVDVPVGGDVRAFSGGFGLGGSGTPAYVVDVTEGEDIYYVYVGG